MVNQPIHFYSEMCDKSGRGYFNYFLCQFVVNIINLVICVTLPLVQDSSIVTYPLLTHWVLLQNSEKGFALRHSSGIFIGIQSCKVIPSKIKSSKISSFHSFIRPSMYIITSLVYTEQWGFWSSRIGKTVDALSSIVCKTDAMTKDLNSLASSKTNDLPIFP